jgi:hypothetical protein
MQTNPNTFISLKYIFVLAILVLGANWFFTFQLVCLKDDNSFYYMPIRMYLSDALHAGTLPYWNPFLMNGVPQYADMQGAVWNPIAFVLCYFFKYNHSLFLLEYIIYIFIGAAGLFKLLGLITKNQFYLFAGVTVYICSGFVSGIANFINWTASLGFIPWVFYCYFKTVKQPNFRNSILLGIASWLMLVCGYPAFIIYSIYCLLALFIWHVWQQIKQGKSIWKSLQFLLLALIISLILSLPAIIAYIEFLPFYSRGKDLATDLPFRDCYYPQFLSSLFIPTSVYNKSYDVLCHSANRDLYFGILPLLSSVLFMLNYKKNKTSFIILLTGIAIFTFIFLFGFLTPLGTFSFKFLPLMGAFKWSAAARVFLIIILIAAGVYQLNKGDYNLSLSNIKVLKWICVIMLWGIAIVFLLTNKYSAFETPLHHKIFYLNTVIQIILWVIALVFIKQLLTQKKLFLLFVVVDLLINYSIGMAITGVGNVRPAVFNNYAKAFYQQQPDEYLKKPLAENRKLYMFDPWKNHNASKIMNGATFLMSNTIFSGYEKKFVVDTSNEQILRNHAFAFSEDIDSVVINSAHLTYTNIQLNIDCKKAGNIIVQQNNYYRWRETNGLSITTWKDCFMQLPVNAGNNKINLEYNRGNYKQLMMLSYVFLLLLIGVLLFSSRNKILSTQRQP